MTLSMKSLAVIALVALLVCRDPGSAPGAQRLMGSQFLLRLVHASRGFALCLCRRQLSRFETAYSPKYLVLLR